MAERAASFVTKDPVCGMSVDPGQTRWRSSHAGTEYFFCARGCKVAFDRDPGRYVKAAAR